MNDAMPMPFAVLRMAPGGALRTEAAMETQDRTTALNAEVTLRWGGRTRVEVRRVAPGERLDAGGAPGTLAVGQGLAASGRFPFVSQGVEGASVFVPRGCPVRSLDGSVIGAAGGPVELSGDDVLPGRRIALSEGQGIRIGFGALDVDVRTTRGARLARRSLSQRFDLEFGTRLTVLLLVAVTFQRAVAITDFEGDGIDHTMASTPLTQVGFAAAPPPKIVDKFKQIPMRSQVTVPGAVARAPSKTDGKPSMADQQRKVNATGLLDALQKLGGATTAVFASGSPGMATALNGLRPAGGGGDQAGIAGISTRIGPGGVPGGPIGIAGFGGRRSGGPTCDGDCALGGPSGLKKADATFQPQRLVVKEGLSADVVGRVIRRHWNEVKSCYERRLQADPNLGGKVAMRFVIGPAGLVGEAGASENTTGDDVLESCIAAKVLAWVFPAPAGGGVVEVNYPFLLNASR